MAGADWVILILLGVTLGAMVLGLLHSRWVAWRINQRILEAERVEIRAFPDGGFGRVIGVVRTHDEGLESPLTGHRCVAYEVVVEEATGGGQGLRRIAHERRAVPFVVDDRTGRAVVRPEHASLALSLQFEAKAGALEDPDPRQREFLRRVGREDLVEHNSLSEIRFRERILEVGRWVSVLGRGVVSSDPGAPPPTEHARGYRAPADATMVTISAGAGAPVYISDDGAVLREATRDAPEAGAEHDDERRRTPSSRVQPSCATPPL